MKSMSETLNTSGNPWYMDWLYGGVDFTIEGNGGRSCSESLPIWTRSTESIFIIILSLVEVVWALSNITFEGQAEKASEEDEQEKPSSSEFHISSDRAPVELNCVVHAGGNAIKRDPWPITKRVLLVLLCMVLGIEIGYKFATKSIIYLLNPCHMLSFAQIYLLASDHRKKCKNLNAVFRIHLYLLNGVLLAMLFPVLNTRFLPFEQGIYWIQHILLYIIPIYLISLGGSYTPDSLSDMRWPILSIGVGFLYHFILLQSLAMITQTNLNNMLCPAVSDPFKGEHYRKFATAHQHIMIILHQKLYHLLAGILTRIISAVHWFCIAVTLKMWRWTIHLCYISARACVRVSARSKIENENKNNACINVIKVKAS